MHTDVFRAVSDPTRRRILAVLADGPVPAGQLVARFPELSQPAVSKHLRILREADLVEQQPRGRQRIYRLRPEPLREIDRWISEYRRFWEDRLDRLESLLDDRG